MTAEEESRETKQEQDESWHEPRFLDYIVMKVKPLPENRILANHRHEDPSKMTKARILLPARGVNDPNWPNHWGG